MTRVQRRFSLDDRAASVYQYVEVDVPASAPALAVSLDYDPEGAVVDLGLVGPDRFGGWSGSERRRVTVTPSWATPGYVPGIVAGSWQVVLGLHRLPPSGLDVSVEVTFAAAVAPDAPPPPPVPVRQPRRQLPASSGRRWVAVDLHSHTVHSDGRLELVELACLAAERGLDALAITDHNTVSHHPHLRAAGAYAGVHLLPGQEVTTDRGHANCFGDIGWIDFRQPPDTWMHAASERGGVMAVNHPWAGDCAWRMSLTEPAPLVEMWHDTWDRLDVRPLEEWTRFGRVAVGGSDFHRPGAGGLPGAPTTWVEVDELGTQSILDALRLGRVALSADPLGPVAVPHDGEVVVVDASGCVLDAAEHGTRRLIDDRVTVPAGPTQVRSVDGRLVAWTAGT